MNEILNKIKTHKELWFIIPISMYFVSFILEFVYYQNFNINISYYISPLGLIFSFASFFIGFFLILLIHTVVALGIKFFIWTGLQKDVKISEIFVSLLVPMYLIKRYSYFSVYIDDMLANYMIAALLISSIFNIATFKRNSLYRFFALMIVLTIAIHSYTGGRGMYSAHGCLNAVSFSYNGNIIQSNGSSRVFIGETDEYLFLHNNHKNELFVFKKSNIDSLVIKPPAVTIINGKSIYQPYELLDLLRKVRSKTLTAEDSLYIQKNIKKSIKGRKTA